MLSTQVACAHCKSCLCGYTTVPVTAANHVVAVHSNVRWFTTSVGAALTGLDWHAAATTTWP
jgi:hypothetical protein